MRIIRKEEIKVSDIIKNPNGEEIYEMIGSSSAIGGTIRHSLVHVIIPPGKSSHAHYHEVSEETYYILKGVGLIIIDEKRYELHPGQACLIHTHEKHQIFNKGKVNLEFLTISAPAWRSDDSFFVPEQK